MDFQLVLFKKCLNLPALCLGDVYVTFDSDYEQIAYGMKNDYTAFKITIDKTDNKSDFEEYDDMTLLFEYYINDEYAICLGDKLSEIEFQLSNAYHNTRSRKDTSKALMKFYRQHRDRFKTIPQCPACVINRHGIIIKNDNFILSTYSDYYGNAAVQLHGRKYILDDLVNQLFRDD